MVGTWTCVSLFKCVADRIMSSANDSTTGKTVERERERERGKLNSSDGEKWGVEGGFIGVWQEHYQHESPE